MKAHHLILAAVVFIPCWRGGLAEQPSVKPIEKPTAKRIVIPFETLKSGHMAVKIKVNGKGPYRVIFDTGAPINLLNNKLAKEAGLLKDAPRSMLPFFGAIAEVKVKELQVGERKSGQSAGHRHGSSARRVDVEKAGTALRHRRLSVLRSLQDDRRLPGRDADAGSQRLQAGQHCAISGNNDAATDDRRRTRWRKCCRRPLNGE